MKLIKAIKPDETGKSKLGLSLLLISGICFYFAWQVFQAAERTNLYVIQTCGNATKGLGQEALSFYADCISGSSSGSSGGYILIVVGIIVGIIGLLNLISTDTATESNTK